MKITLKVIQKEYKANQATEISSSYEEPTGLLALSSQFWKKLWLKQKPQHWKNQKGLQNKVSDQNERMRCRMHFHQQMVQLESD